MRNIFQNSDVVITGLQPWDTQVGSNCKDIAIELSKTNRVLYVNRALDRITLYKSRKKPIVQNRLRAIKGQNDAITRVSENLWVLNPKIILESINFLPHGLFFHFFNKHNNALIAREIKKAIKELDFKDVILFNDNDFIRSYYLPEFINHRLTIYYLRDYLTIRSYFKKHKMLEPELMRKSDFVMTNSEFLADYGRKFNKHSFFIGQGFDQSIFVSDNLRLPNDLRGITGPVIGYIGFLTSERLDIKLLEYLAINLTSYSIVLVGLEDHQFKESILHGLPNVFFLGQKPQQEVSSYIAGFDVCINPQLVSQLTIGNYPRKIDEYLILEKPVVATKTQAMKYFKRYTYLADSYEDFLKCIHKALEEDTKEIQSARKRFAQDHTWEQSVSLMKGFIQTSLKAKLESNY